MENNYSKDNTKIKVIIIIIRFYASLKDVSNLKKNFKAALTAS